MHKRKPPPWREGQDWSCHFHQSQLRNVSWNVLHHLPWLCTWEDKSWHIFYVQNLHLPSCWKDLYVLNLRIWNHMEIAVGCSTLVVYKSVCDEEFFFLQIQWWGELWKIVKGFFQDPLRVIKCPSPAGNQWIAKTSCTLEIWRIESELPSFWFLSSRKPSMMILLQYSIELMSAQEGKHSTP